MHSDLSLLRANGWLSHLPCHAVDEILKDAIVEDYDDQTIIYGLGQDQYDLCGVVSGCVRMFVSMNNEAAQCGHLAGPGFWFGEGELITRAPRIIETIASGRTRICRVAERTIERLSLQNPEMWRHVALLAALNQFLAVGAADDLLIRNSRRRLIAVLLRLSALRNAYQNPVPLLSIRATQAEIATAANLSLALTGSILSELSRTGAIRREYGTVSIVDPEGLEALLDD